MRPLLALVAVCAGCQRAAELQFVPSEQVTQLSEPLQKTVADQLTHYCGTPTNPKLLGDDSASREHLQHGAAVYQKRCVACHGVTGDGAGPAAEYLYPRPRDYRRGFFKFSSTPFGAKPRREDLLRTVRRGAKGTSMPSFALLPDEDIQAVVDYVLALTHRGELEVLLALEAETEDEIAPQRVPELVKEITDQWQKASTQVVLPVTKMPPYTPETVELGKQAFLSEVAGCVKCHGPEGRAAFTDHVEEYKDGWGHQTRAADLTSGMFHGGDRPDDIYRRIYAGINGTPMPSFDQKLSAQPETFWHLVHYVKFVSSERRRAVVEQAKEQGLPHASGN